MLIFDTETTGLVKNESLPVEQQPKIIEFGALKVNEDLEVIDEINFLVNPGIPLPGIITKITGIKDSDLKNESPFIEYYGALAEFFLGEKTMVAHNMPFDRNLLRFELMRVDKLLQFPWPMRHICTAELSSGVGDTGKYMKLENLYKHYYKMDAQQTHRATDDCHLLLKVIKKMREEDGLI